MSAPIVERLGDEADLCRNDGADDIAILLDEAADTITDLLAALEELHLKTVVGTEQERHDALNKAWDAIAKAKATASLDAGGGE